MHVVRNAIVCHDGYIGAQFSVPLYFGGSLVERIVDLGSADVRGRF